MGFRNFLGIFGKHLPLKNFLGIFGKLPILWVYLVFMGLVIGQGFTLDQRKCHVPGLDFVHKRDVVSVPNRKRSKGCFTTGIDFVNSQDWNPVRLVYPISCSTIDEDK